MMGINKEKSVISQYCNQQRVVVCAFKAFVKLPKSYKSAVCGCGGSVEAYDMIYSIITYWEYLKSIYFSFIKPLKACRMKTQRV